MVGVPSSVESDLLTALLTATPYIALFMGDPDSTGVEVSGGAYARQPYVYSITGGNPVEAANTAPIVFPDATADWGIVTHTAIYSAVVAGLYRQSSAVAVAKDIKEGDVAKWAVGNFKVKLGDRAEFP